MIKSCKKHGEQTYIQNGVNPKTGSPKYRCPECSKEWVNKHRHDYKKKLIELCGGKCVRCGYDKYFGALQFHHRDPSEKDFNLSTREMNTGWDQILKEVSKCDLLCANCHAEVHAGL